MKIKKILIIPIILLLTTGCMYLNNASYDDIVDEIVNNKKILSNHVNKGFKYYLPRSLKSTKVDSDNEILKSSHNDYYLYVDLVSYYNKITTTYNVDVDNYYSSKFTKNDIDGIVNIIKDNSNYIVKVTYNYATVEVKTDDNYLNEVLSNSLIIVTSIKYNDEVIESLLLSKSLIGTEEQIIMFDGANNDNNDTLEYDDTYTGDETKDYDPDIIN